MSFRCKRAVLGAAITLVFNPALAATVDEAAVVVTASRFSGPVGRAIGATVISAEEITQSTATTIGEVLDRLGGVNVRRNLLGTEDAEIDMRGFGVTGSQNTLVLVDGQRISENELAGARISAIPLASIERIEILRGSGAVVYGPGATGGVINIVTRPATAAAPQAYVFGLAGALDTRELRAGGRVSRGQLGISFDASERRSDNWRDNNRSRSTAASGEARIAIDQGFVALRFAADDQDSRLPGARTEVQLKTDPRGTGTPNNFAESDTRRVALTVEKKLGDFRLGADLTTRRKDASYAYDYGFGAFENTGTRGTEDAFTPRLAWQTRWGAVRNMLVVGADRRTYAYRKDGLADFGFGATRTAERASQDNTAYYVQDQMTFPSGTELALGVRRERIRQDWQENLTPLAERTQKRSLSAWELAVRQDLGGGIAAHARLGKSYRVANVDENRCFFAPCSPLLLPQTSRDHAVGLEWSRGRNLVRAEWFDMRVKDELYFNRLDGAFGANSNMPPLRRTGLQIDAKWSPLDTLDIDAHYTATRARFTDGTFSGVNMDGNDVPLVPRQRMSVQLGWQFLATTRLTLAHSYVGTQRYDNDQANRFRHMPAYGITDVKVSHRWHGATLSAGINNLFDKAAYSYGIVNNPLAPTTFNAYPDARRTAYVSAEYPF